MCNNYVTIKKIDRACTKNEAKNIKSENLKGINREKSKIAVTILRKKI